jgi:hypothetical protein
MGEYQKAKQFVIHGASGKMLASAGVQPVMLRNRPQARGKNALRPQRVRCVGARHALAASTLTPAPVRVVLFAGADVTEGEAYATKYPAGV